MDTLSSPDSQSSKTSVYPSLTENCTGNLVEAKRNEKLIVVTGSKKPNKNISHERSECQDSFRVKSPVSVTSPVFSKNEEKHQDVILKQIFNADTKSDKHVDNLIVGKDLNNSDEHASKVSNKRDEWIDVDYTFTEHIVKEEQRSRDDLVPDQVSINSPLAFSVKEEIGANHYGIECESHHEDINSVEYVTPDGTALDALVCISNEHKVADEHWKELYKDEDLFQSNVSLPQAEVEKIGLTSRSNNSKDFESGTIHHLNLLVSPSAEACDSSSANLPYREAKADIQKTGLYSKNKDWKSVRTSLSVQDEKITLEFKPIMCSNTLTRNYNNSNTSRSVANGEDGINIPFSVVIPIPNINHSRGSIIERRQEK
ncbi:uncharacterized protein LOC111089258, partial [Limulus polyphemus]|uniref:Uncharacterized protein LOC111089258 n=1 Tax=Limulus polyphemus TaxID=6850 RepID=A0ABM1TMM0_LIMPO